MRKAGTVLAMHRGVNGAKFARFGDKN